MKKYISFVLLLLCSFFGCKAMEVEDTDMTYVSEKTEIAENSVLKNTFLQAAEKGYLDDVAMCVQHGVAIAEEDFETGQTALELAASNGHEDIVAYLLHVSTVQNRPIDTTSALRVCLESADYPLIVDMLCKAGAELWSDKVPLLVAAEEARNNSLEAMIPHIMVSEDRDRILSEENEDGDNALAVAIEEGHADTARILSCMGVPNQMDVD